MSKIEQLIERDQQEKNEEPDFRYWEMKMEQEAEKFNKDDWREDQEHERDLFSRSYESMRDRDLC